MFAYVATLPSKVTWRGRLKRIRNFFRRLRG